MVISGVVGDSDETGDGVVPGTTSGATTFWVVVSSMSSTCSVVCTFPGVVTSSSGCAGTSAPSKGALPVVVSLVTVVPPV